MIKSYLQLLVASTKASTESLAAWLFHAGFMFLNNAIFFVIWLVLFRNTTQIGGWSLQDTMLLFGISAIAFGLATALFGGMRNIPELLREGEINSILLRPRSPLLLVLSSKSDPYGWGDVLFGLLLVIGSQQLSWVGWLLFPLIILLSTAVAASVTLCIFSIAFWMQRSDVIAWRAWETFLTFCLYPEGIFPAPMRVVLYTILPAAFVAFLPVAVLKSFSLATLAILVLVTIFWAALSWGIFYRGLRRYIRQESGV